MELLASPAFQIGGKDGPLDPFRPQIRFFQIFPTFSTGSQNGSSYRGLTTIAEWQLLQASSRVKELPRFMEAVMFSSAEGAPANEHKFDRSRIL